FHFDDAERVLTSDVDSSTLSFVGVRPPVPPQSLLSLLSRGGLCDRRRLLCKTRPSSPPIRSRDSRPRLGPHLHCVGSGSIPSRMRPAIRSRLIESASSSERSSRRAPFRSPSAHPRSDRLGTTPGCPQSLSIAPDV